MSDLGGTPREHLAQLYDIEDVQYERDVLRARVDTLTKTLRDTEVAFWCVLSAAGGEVTVSRQVFIVRPSKAVLERTDDPVSGAITWRAVLEHE